MDKLILAKFQFFHDIAEILSVFLKQFQTDNPVMPFICDVLETIIRRLMKMFMPSRIVKNASTPYQLIKLDVSSKDNQLPISSVKLTTATESFLTASGVKDSNKLQFRKECVILLVKMIEKLQERSPMKYQIVRCMTSLVPKNLVSNEEECVLKFGKMVDKMFAKKHLSAKEADEAKCQCDDFLADIVRIHKDEFTSFHISLDRLDSFFGKYLHHNDKYKSLWKVMICVFTFSHGQS